MRMTPWIVGVALVLSLVNSGRAKPVELMVDGDTLQPSTTLEVRFPNEMVQGDAVGLPAENSPLLIEPDLTGAFTWLSSRSGVFAPSVPPKLGTTYHVSLRPGLNDANGSPVGPGFERELQTPPFKITVLRKGYSDKADLPPSVTVRFAFNLEVKEDAQFQFVGDDGRKIEAEVRYATPDDYFQIPAEDGDWIARWKASIGEKPAVSETAPGSEEGDGEVLRDRLLVTPARPLSPDVEWTLEMLPGLESLTGEYRIEVGTSIPLGRVRPFVLESVSPSSLVNSGRSVTLEFSAPLAPDVDAATSSKFFRVRPEVPNLVFEEGWRAIVIRGDFERGVEYSVEIDPDLLSDSLLPISGDLARKFSFEPVRPRVYLPAFTGHQLSEGLRKFEVLSVNLQQLRVKALLVDHDAVARAVATFNKDYEKTWEDVGDSGEPYHALPEGAIAGEVIFERTYEVGNQEIDAPQRTVLSWDEVLGDRKTGGVLLTVEGVAIPGTGDSRPAAQSLLQLTDLGVLWKQVEETVRVNVFSMETGAALGDVHVQMLDKEFGETAVARTDGKGTVTVPPGEEPGWMVVSKGEDIFAFPLGPSAQELPMAAFGLPVYYRGWKPAQQQKPESRGLLFTDRPMYRPGEKVQVKGIIRRIGEEALEFAANESGTLRLFLPQGKGQVDVEIATDERGAFDATLELDRSVVGQYGLSVSLENAYYFTHFFVAEFQPNAFEVDVEMPARFAPSESVEAGVSAKYFFGTPITDARVQWTWQSSPRPFSAAGFEDFEFGVESGGERKTLTVRGETGLDATARIAPRLPAPEGEPQHGVLTVEVTDLNQQTVTATRSYVRDASAFYLGVSVKDRRVVGVGEEFEVIGVAVDPTGLPLEKPIEVEAELVRLDYRTVRVLGAGEAISFRTETIEKREASAKGTTLVPTRENGKWVFSSGQSATFKPSRPGTYRLALQARDSEGRTVRGERSVYVSGEGRLAWDYRHPSQVDLVPDRSEYRVGDTAKILVKSPFSGEALVSVERGQRILRQFRVPLEGNAPTIDVPVEAGDSPNVFVSMMVIRGAADSTRKFKVPEYRYGVCNLGVANPRAELGVRVAPVQPVVEPGDEVSVEIAVTGGDGAPVPNAEVTFFAVDEGILALTGYQRPDPANAFGGMFPLNVRTGLTLWNLLPEDPADLEFGNKGYLIGGGGLEGPGPKLRTDFPGTAVWLPSLRTDEKGKVVATFTAPDALTRYRLVAVAHANADRFGSGESTFAIRKPLMLLSGLGQIAHVGDELIARAVLRNESGVDGDATVTLKLDKTAQAAGAPLSVTFPIKNGESHTVDLPVKFVEMGDAEWTWSARLAAGAQKFGDAMTVSMRVGSAAPLLREIYLADLRDRKTDLLEGVNPQLLEGTGTMTVVLSNTRLASLREAADSLLTYPYGCAEQLVSGLIPWLAVSDLSPVLPELPQNATERKEAVEESIAKIFALQTGGGGLSYWPDGGKPALFPSAWAVVALSRAGKESLPAGWDKLLSYLSGELRGLGEKTRASQLGDFALAVYALARAGQPEPAYHEVLLRRRAELSHESRALLALAMLATQGADRDVRWLLDTRNSAPEQYDWFGSRARSLAVRLLAWTRFEPENREVGTLVAELLQSRRNGKWRTTQENAWALLALSDYFTKVEGDIRPVDATLLQAEKSWPVHLTPKRLTETWEADFGPRQPPGPVVAENPGKRNLYGETRFVVRPAVEDQPRQDRGYAVSRTYEKIGNDGTPTDVSSLRVGDRVLVTLRVETPRPGHFVAIDDPLPAILEAVNPEFAVQGVGGSQFERVWRADYRETRADRVVYFCNHLPRGAHTFRYLARVRSAGDVIAPPTKVEEMYRPERFGMSASARLESGEAIRR